MQFTKIEKCDIVEQINITHNLELFINECLKTYKKILNVSPRTSNEIVLKLLTKEKPIYAKSLKTLIDSQNLIKFKAWCEKT